MAETDLTVVVTRAHKLSYVFVDEPRAARDGGKAKYDLTILIPKDSPDIKKIRAAVQAAFEKQGAKVFGVNPETTTIPKKWRQPLNDGDEWYEEHPEAKEYQGCYYIKASSTNKPPLWDKVGNDIFDGSEIYSGSICQVSMRCFAYNNESKGFSFYLNGIRKVADGERIGGGGKASFNDFGDSGFDDDDDFDHEPTPKAPKAKAVVKKAAAKAPKRQWSTQDGEDIYSDDGGETWFFADDDNVPF